MILIPSGTQLAQVTVAGEIDIGLLYGSSAMAAALQGADLKVIGNAGNKMIFSLYVKPEIKTVEALRGKKIGITRYGSAPDISIRYALKKYNLNPEKDLTLIGLHGIGRGWIERRFHRRGRGFSADALRRGEAGL
jgi:ABC-type nitrate/sulfonate/bicarbonate transport system substrate-binding protein